MTIRMTKRCTVCKNDLPLSSYSKRSGRGACKNGLDYTCKLCNKVANKARYAANPERYIAGVTEWRNKNRERYRVWQKGYTKSIRHVRRDSSLKKLYGIGSKEYEAMLAEQGGVCAVCGTNRPGQKSEYFNVDHDHTSKFVRGLLCTKCNIGIGFLCDDPLFLVTAAAYLVKAINAEAAMFIEEVKNKKARV